MSTQIKEAIEHAGGVAAVAEHFGINPVSVYEWIRRGCVPADKCPQIEKFSNGVVRCEELNDQVDWAFIRATNPIDPPPSRAGRHPTDPVKIMSATTGQAPTRKSAS